MAENKKEIEDDDDYLISLDDENKPLNNHKLLYEEGYKQGKLEIINKIKTKYCPMCAKPFEDCNCNVPAFSVKWLRERLNDLNKEKEQHGK